jgi:hypothetical protein
VHRIPSRIRRLTAAAAMVAAALATATVSVKPAFAAQQPAGVNIALEWYDMTAAAVAVGASTQVTNNRTWAISWLAAARALRATPPSPGARDYQDAALASAVHEALVALIPGRTAELDAAFDSTLARVPAGPAKEQGVAAGQQEARSLLTERAGDGLDPASVNAPYPTPTPEPGVWQPTPPAFGPALQSGNRSARPFLLSRADQLRPGPPPALGSRRYRTDLEEVRAYGAADSTVRTEAQTDTSTFWYGSSLTLYTAVLRAALAQSTHSLAWQTALVAIFHVALVDTQIATSDAKYAYLSWRPVTAIRNADIDGDPATVADPAWNPLHVTPSHPDYPVPPEFRKTEGRR